MELSHIVDILLPVICQRQILRWEFPHKWFIKEVLLERVVKAWRKWDRKEVKDIISSCSPAICHFSQITKGILECKLCLILPSLWANCWTSLTADSLPLSSSVRIAFGWRELHHAWLHCLPKGNLEQVRRAIWVLELPESLQPCHSSTSPSTNSASFQILSPREPDLRWGRFATASLKLQQKF